MGFGMELITVVGLQRGLHFVYRQTEVCNNTFSLLDRGSTVKILASGPYTKRSYLQYIQRSDAAEPQSSCHKQCSHPALGRGLVVPSAWPTRCIQYQRWSGCHTAVSRECQLRAPHLDTMELAFKLPKKLFKAHWVLIHAGCCRGGSRAAVCFRAKARWAKYPLCI